MLISLPKGLVTEISEEDFELCFYNWYCSGGYVRRTKNGQKQFLHNLVVERVGLIIPPNYEVDHIDQIKLNNKRDNLRIVTHSINMHNIAVRETSTTGHKGITYLKKTNQWLVRLQVNYNRITIGTFNTLPEALIAKDAATIKYLGSMV